MEPAVPTIKYPYGNRLNELKRAGALLIAVVIFLIDSFSSLDVAVAVLYILVILISVDLFSRSVLVYIACLCSFLTVVAFVLSHGVECSDESCGRGFISIAAISIASLLALKSSASKQRLKEQVALLDRSQAFLAGAQRLSLTGSIGFLVPCTQMYWSDEARRIFEFEGDLVPTFESMLAKTHAEDRDRLRGAVEHIFSTQDPLEVEFRLVMQDGRGKHLRMWARRYDNSGQDCEFIGALMDITSTREAEEALHRSQAELAHVTRVTTLGELAASIAHEVNQPLAAVLTNAQAGIRWLDHEPPNVGEVRNVIQRIVVQAQRAGDVVKKVRDLSRKTNAPHEKLDLSELLAESLTLVRREVYRHQVVLNVNVDEQTGPVYGDRVQLQQVIINLVMNAVQSLSTGRAKGRTVLVRISRGQRGGVELRVRDNGGGIPEHLLVDIFSPFFTTKTTGMGMGLSICRSIIDSHAGKIWAVNDVSGGAIVGFQLPSYEVARNSIFPNAFVN